MTGIVIFFHASVAVILIVIVLMQSGRGGGLTEGFGGAAESVFGARTNEFMIKATAVAGTVFLLTSLSLAYFSSRTERSVMEDVAPGRSITVEIPVDKIPELPKGVTAPESRVIDGMESPVKAEPAR